MIRLPIRLILGDGIGEGRAMTIIFENTDGTAGRLTINYAGENFRKVSFTDSESCVVFGEKKGFFNSEVIPVAVQINREFHKSRN